MDQIFLDTDPVANKPLPPTSDTAGETGVPPTSIQGGDVEQPLIFEPELFQETCGTAAGHIANSRSTNPAADLRLTFTDNNYGDQQPILMGSPIGTVSLLSGKWVAR